MISRTGFLPLWGLPCTSEFLRWPLRRLTIRMRSLYTPIYYRKSPVPSIELSNIAARSTYNSVCHLLSCPRSSRLRTYYSLIPLDHRVTSRTAHKLTYRLASEALDNYCAWATSEWLCITNEGRHPSPQYNLNTWDIHDTRIHMHRYTGALLTLT